MKTDIFDFSLPDELIATQPATPRDSARMLVVDDGLQDANVKDLLGFLRAGDVMVFNDSKVIPARLWGKRGEVKIEILLHKKNDTTKNTWKCFARPAKRLKIGDAVAFYADFQTDNFQATVLEKYDDGQVLLDFDYEDAIFWKLLDKYGQMPLPPYIEKSRKAASSDTSNYQTIYARHSGSVAAPTAGLHFTDELLAEIDKIGVKRVHVTLHVGGGTFLPVKVDDTTKHIMHSEFASVSKEVANTINAAKQAGGRIIAIGTTSVRTLESATDNNGKLHCFSAETDIFITPSYCFKLVDIMLTNFHLPKSTLFMLVCAFAGTKKMQSAYDHAITEKYRFYSYGDACLLIKKAEKLNCGSLS